jgi:Uma2 family endonuclease
MSREDCYHRAQQQPRGRFECIDGHVVAMAPEKGAHLRMNAGDNDYEPDAIVNCGPRMNDDAITAPNPVVVVQVLSPSTAGTDTGAKLAGYVLVSSIIHYLIVHPARPQVIQHRRRTDTAAGHTRQGSTRPSSSPARFSLTHYA